MRLGNLIFLLLFYSCSHKITNDDVDHYHIIEERMVWCYSNSSNTSDTTKNEILAKYKGVDLKTDSLYQVWYNIESNRKYIIFNKNTRIYIK